MKQTWLITGATRGIGMEIVKAALSAGMNVCATGRSLEKLRDTFPAQPGLLLLPLDVCDRQQQSQVVEDCVKHFGRIDVLVNNAGYGQMGYFEEVKTDSVKAQFETNVFGQIAMTQTTLPYMRQQRAGQIFNFSSIGGAIGYDIASIYCASKFAVEGYSASLAREVSRFGITITIVEPGFFRTDFLDIRSVHFASPSVSDYDSLRQEGEKNYREYNHAQPGSPAKLAQALLTLAAAQEKPLRFAAGSDAFDLLTQEYESRLAELTTWKNLTCSTDIAR
ncbi:SDR family NAD(P)-dependent oxidoreductase [Enterobacteriaceae bacterium H18W14]|uniref:SDR family NAD(P)-dependent oxidoreductase n=1 Tax=Dryocola boscaweniae TaxID=2925397 RepID=UPI0022F0CC8B|nr:SDR family NAD(P)-dependent oxidoreductase [Dryocola boscaweniae]MCT4717125.1 SDR family NAD(P)-dependent oxidoreductase [Dryocola boscaweniae]